MRRISCPEFSGQGVKSEGAPAAPASSAPLYVDLSGHLFAIKDGQVLS